MRRAFGRNLLSIWSTNRVKSGFSIPVSPGKLLMSGFISQQGFLRRRYAFFFCPCWFCATKCVFRGNYIFIAVDCNVENLLGLHKSSLPFRWCLKKDGKMEPRKRVASLVCQKYLFMGSVIGMKWGCFLDRQNAFNTTGEDRQVMAVWQIQRPSRNNRESWTTECWVFFLRKPKAHKTTNRQETPNKQWNLHQNPNHQK